MKINKFDINIDQKLDINKDDLLKYFDDIKSYKNKDIPYWIINDKKREYIIYEKNKVLYIHNKLGSKKYNNTEIKKCEKSKNKMESKYGGSGSVSGSISDTKCNSLFKNIKISDEILCLEKLLRYIKYTQRSSNKKIFKEITTFSGLETFLRENYYDKIHDFMKEYSLEFQQKFEPLESIFRLFCSKKLIKIYDDSGNDIFKNSYISTNNFGDGKVTINDNHSISGESNLKDSGDISDLTFVNKDTSTIYICSSKNYKDYSGKGKKFDLEKIKNVYKDKYTDVFKNIITIVVVRDKNEVLNAMKNMTFSSKDSKNLLKNSHFVDFDDINQAYRQFKYGTVSRNINFARDIDPIHLRYFKESNLEKKDIILTDKNDNPRIFKGWDLEDEKDCKFGKIDKLDDIIKTFSTTEIIKYYKNFSYIFSILLEKPDDKQTDDKQTDDKQTDDKQTDDKQTTKQKTKKKNAKKQTDDKQTDDKQTNDYIKLIFGETVIVNEKLYVINQQDKDNLYNILQNYCFLNNSKEDVSILVIVENLDNKKYKIITKKDINKIEDINKIKLEEYNTLVNLSNKSIYNIVKKFLKVNSDKSYNFIVDKDNSRLEGINEKFGIKDFFAFKSSSLLSIKSKN
jgi:hypothetical protein